MWASGLVVHDSDTYLIVSALLLSPFGVLAAYWLGRMRGWRALLFAVGPAIVLYAFHNWDLLVVAATVGGFFAWRAGGYGWAGVLFGVGAALKMYPAFFLVPLALDRLTAKDKDGAAQGFFGGVGAFAAINLPFILVGREGWLATYKFHRIRGADFNSIWHWGWPSLGPEELNLITALLVAGSFVAILGAGLFRARREGAFPFIEVCGAMLAAFLLWNKVHSPQYTLWLLPFFVLVRVHWLWWAAYSIVDVVFYFGIFRWFYDFGARGIDFGLAKQALLFGIWGRAALLLALMAVFTAAGRPTVSHPSVSLSLGEQAPAEG